jgi:Fic family protein
MLYAPPPSLDSDLLAEIGALRVRLGREVAQARPWITPLRRHARASTAHSSVGIEGFAVTSAAALAIVDGGPASDADQAALADYALAMRHVAALSDEPWFAWSERLLLDLHFEVCSSQPASRPGRARTGPVGVTAPGGGIAYAGPGADVVRSLLEELCAWLTACELPVVVAAAMAHLHLVSIHPFVDGNGRMSRILQSLVLARDGVLCPELGSIEEHLAADTAGYYAVLREVQGGSYQPTRDAGPWVRFCLEAHRTAALQRIGLIEQAAARWGALEDEMARRGWPDRLVSALEAALAGGVDRRSYVAESGVSEATASADLRRLADSGLLLREGAGRDARYRAADALREVVAGGRRPG